MTLRELLKQNELRVVEVAAGADGLHHIRRSDVR